MVPKDTTSNVDTIRAELREKFPADERTARHAIARDINRLRGQQETPRPRHVIPLGSPHPHGWLLDDRPAEYLAAHLIRDDVTTVERLAACQQTAYRHGRDVVRAALIIARREGLTDPAVLAVLRREGRRVRR
jgi:protein-disulfide isomerase-like protein with CxxC motif